MRRFVLVLLMLSVVVVAAACRVETAVEIDVAEDGSSTVDVIVTLDPEAAAQIGDPAALRTQDLTDAGWEVLPIDERSDGSVTLRARRTAASPAELGPVLDEVGGPGGVFNDVTLGLSDGFGSVRYDFDARIELSGDLAQFSDAGVAEALGGLPLGRSAEELAAAGAADPDAARLSVSVRLPGGSPDTNGDVSGDGPYAARWDFPLSGGTPTSQELTSTATAASGATRALLIGGVIAIVIGVVAAVGAVVTRRRTV